MSNAVTTFNALLNYILDQNPDDPKVLMHLWREGSFDEVRQGWPDIPEDVFPKEDPNSLEANVCALLDQCPFTVRDLSGEYTGMRGREFLAGSLSITFLGMQQDLVELKKKATK